MKKYLLLAFFSLSISFTFAQWSTLGSNIYYTGGNVGIGTAYPAEMLHVAGNIKLGYTGGGVNFGLEWYSSSWASGFGHKIYNADPGTGWTDLRIAARNNSGTWTDMMTFTSTGKVGIGTTNPGSYKLAVEGNIGAREIKVTLANPWPDYVFLTKYKLPSLEEIEKFIQQNHHLPNLPSAREVEENKGIELGDMSIKLLEKIEELTLYVIQLKKENEEIKEKLKELSEKK
jgi:hypothetical protein